MNASRLASGSLSRKLHMAALLAAVAALAAPVAAFSQSSPGNDDANEAMHNIQSNFARMTPAPRTVDSINQDLKQGEVKSQASGGGGRHGGGRRGKSSQQNDAQQGGSDSTGTAAQTPAVPPAPATGGATQ